MFGACVNIFWEKVGSFRTRMSVPCAAYVKTSHNGIILLSYHFKSQFGKCPRSFPSGTATPDRAEKMITASCEMASGAGLAFLFVAVEFACASATVSGTRSFVFNDGGQGHESKGCKAEV